MNTTDPDPNPGVDPEHCPDRRIASHCLQCSRPADKHRQKSRKDNTGFYSGFPSISIISLPVNCLNICCCFSGVDSGVGGAEAEPSQTAHSTPMDRYCTTIKNIKATVSRLVN
jgi:hypothetical protein